MCAVRIVVASTLLLHGSVYALSIKAPVFRLGTCNAPEQLPMEKLALVALKDGFLEYAVPNYRDFRVELDLVSLDNSAGPEEQARQIFSCNTSVQPMTALLGSFSSSVAKVVAPIASFAQLPFVSGSAAPNISPHKFLLRTAPSAASRGKSQACLCQHFGWHRVMLIYAREDPQHRDVADGFVDHFYSIVGADAVVMSGNIPAWESLPFRAFAKDFDDAQARQVAGSIARQAPRILISLQSTYGMFFLRYLHAAGLVGPNYALIVDRLTASDLLYPAEHIEQLRQVAPGNAAWFSEYNWVQLPDELLGTLRMDVKAKRSQMSASMWTQLAGNLTKDHTQSFTHLTMFDAAVSVFVAIGSLLSAGFSAEEIRGERLLQQLGAVAFEGASGRVGFGPNGERLHLNSSILNLVPAENVGDGGCAVRFVQIGTYSPSVDQMTISKPMLVCFSDGSSNPPRDTMVSPPTYRELEETQCANTGQPELVAGLTVGALLIFSLAVYHCVMAWCVPDPTVYSSYSSSAVDQAPPMTQYGQVERIGCPGEFVQQKQFRPYEGVGLAVS